MLVQCLAHSESLIMLDITIGIIVVDYEWTEIPGGKNVVNKA